MTEKPDNRPRPTPRTRAGGSPRPSPRPRLAGSRRDRDDVAPAADDTAPAADDVAPVADDTAPTVDDVAPTGGIEQSAAGAASTEAPPRPAPTARPRTPRGASPSSTAAGGRAPGAAGGTATTARRGVAALALTLAVLCLIAAVGAGLLLWQRLNPTSVNTELFAAARTGVEALYFYDYEDSESSIQRKLDATTGELREQQEQTWQGAIIDQYEQASAKGRYEVTDVGLQQVNEAQDTATLVVFGQLVVESVNAGTQPAPPGSECRAATGTSTCIYTLRVTVVQVDGEWKLSDAVILSTS